MSVANQLNSKKVIDIFDKKENLKSWIINLIIGLAGLGCPHFNRLNYINDVNEIEAIVL